MQLPQAVSDELHGALVRYTPTAALAGVSTISWSGQQVIWFLTGLLLTLQCAYLIWKWHREAQSKPSDDHPDDYGV